MAGRKTLPHDPPRHIDPAREIWFLTVCCQPRGKNQLARPELWPFLAESIQRRVETGAWWMHLFVAMPDHCHALASFLPTGDMKKTMADWKRWLATQRGIGWQIDFFDHRLRHDESFEEKSRYILQNPVRAGLVVRPEDWPYVWRPKEAAPFTGLHH
jgi:REP element-mobilizing transposase RayT